MSARKSTSNTKKPVAKAEKSGRNAHAERLSRITADVCAVKEVLQQANFSEAHCGVIVLERAIGHLDELESDIQLQSEARS